MANPNPFTPIFGKIPPYMAGRQDVITRILEAFEEGSNSPDIASLLVGARGTGKTALLSYLSFEATQRGWICADVTAESGMLEDIYQRTAESAAHLVDQHGKPKIKGIQLGALGIDWETQKDATPNWRSKMNGLLDQLEQSHVGLLITVDEVNPRINEVRTLVDTFQHFIRENRHVALLMAGLPHNVSLLVSKYSTSFLRRAAKHTLGPIADYEVEEAFNQTITQGGRTIEPQAIHDAVRNIAGFPFMFQLVGYRSWNVSPNNKTISFEDTKAGIALAHKELEERIYDATLSTLTQNDIDFLLAMTKESETRQTDIAKKLNKPSSHVSTYKNRMLEQGIIESPRKGIVRFCLPGFDTYLKKVMQA